MIKDFTVYYNFRLPDGSEEGFHLRLDPETLELRGNTPEVSPEWTKLDFHQCPNCPLNVEEHPDCPLALRLVNLVQRFDGLLSHEKVEMEVVTEERTITQKTTAQRGISSLMGLVIAASGCPHTALLRPMARFHLPFASNEETVYRATSMYLLAQYFLKKEGASWRPGARRSGARSTGTCRSSMSPSRSVCARRRRPILSERHRRSRRVCQDGGDGHRGFPREDPVSLRPLFSEAVSWFLISPLMPLSVRKFRRARV